MSKKISAIGALSTSAVLLGIENTASASDLFGKPFKGLKGVKDVVAPSKMPRPEILVISGVATKSENNCIRLAGLIDNSNESTAGKLVPSENNTIEAFEPIPIVVSFGEFECVREMDWQ